MTKMLCNFGGPGQTMENLVNFLSNSEQDPLVMRDSNPFTGDMLIVRTKSPLPGTRYFHAQFFTDSNGHEYLQHVSFEFRPGPMAMPEAIRAVEDGCGSLSKPTFQKDRFQQWDLGHGYVIWIRRLDQNDLQNNPFNAYTDDDLNTIRVAIELNPDDQGEK